MDYKIIKEYMDIDNVSAEKFAVYMELLREWNEKINLTAITDEEGILVKHFFDSCSISEFVDNNSKIIDIGTGAGFPGLPLKIVNDTLNLTLVDSLNKRINFLNEVKNKLGLKNVETVHGRAEDVGIDNKYREKYDFAVSRAVAELRILVEYLLPLVKVGGKVIAMKGPNIDEEVENSKKAVKLLGGEIERIESFRLGNTDNERTIIIIKKIKNTESKYPRKAGIPRKNPL
jgi:16S rRNA methyltransferase gidB